MWDEKEQEEECQAKDHNKPLRVRRHHLEEGIDSLGKFFNTSSYPNALINDSECYLKSSISWNIFRKHLEMKCTENEATYL